MLGASYSSASGLVPRIPFFSGLPEGACADLVDTLTKVVLIYVSQARSEYCK